jgi:hypothetical protein
MIFQIDVSNVHHLLFLLKSRENNIFADMKKKIATAMVFTQVEKNLWFLEGGGMNAFY